MTEVPWITLKPNTKNAWLTEGLQSDFDDFLPIATKEAKASAGGDVKAIFKTYSLGVSTNRDDYLYDFSSDALAERTKLFLANYNSEIHRWVQSGQPKDVDNFVGNEQIKWSDGLKAQLQRKKLVDFDAKHIVTALYRPYCHNFLYYDKLVVERPRLFGLIFPTLLQQSENRLICMSGIGSSKPFHCLISNLIAGLDLLEKTQCFPLYTYALDGKIRRDNVTDWALAQFQAQYGPDVTKRDIFHYVYGLLHSPEYRERYKENLKRELPRIPLVGGGGEEEEAPPPQVWGAGTEPESAEETKTPPGDTPNPAPQNWGGGASSFRRFASAGAALAALHVGYEQADEYPLTQIVNKDVPFSWRVSKMRLNKDKTAVIVNGSLTLAGVPPEAFDYKLGNRSALEWVLDQYQVSTDKRSSIETDPNRADDPEYIVRLVRRVVMVSVETMKIVGALPPLTPVPALLP